jgi:hypothetical protein
MTDWARPASWFASAAERRVAAELIMERAVREGDAAYMWLAEVKMQLAEQDERVAMGAVDAMREYGGDNT